MSDGIQTSFAAVVLDYGNAGLLRPAFLNQFATVLPFIVFPKPRKHLKGHKHINICFPIELDVQ